MKPGPKASEVISPFKPANGFPRVSERVRKQNAEGSPVQAFPRHFVGESQPFGHLLPLHGGRGGREEGPWPPTHEEDEGQGLRS